MTRSLAAETRIPLTEISDQTARRRALSPDRSFIVQAPAGSGKTELLIHRFLRLLGCVDEPEAIVALTFTRKAAAEMRQRVVAALRDATGPDPVCGTAHQRDTWRLARAALSRDETLGWHLVEHPSRLRIQTIDSLCASLVRQMPRVSGMGAPTDPEENADPYYRRAARRTLALLEDNDFGGRAVGRVLAHLDNDAGVAERLIADMLRRRDQWLRHVVGANPARMREEFATLLSEIVRDELSALAASFPKDSAELIVDCARFAAQNLARKGSASPLVLCRNLGRLPGVETRDLPVWLALRELCLNRSGERRRTLDVRQGVPPTEEGRRLKARMLDVVLGDDLVDRLNRIPTLPASPHSDAQWETLESLLEILPIAVAQLQLEFQAAGRVDFIEIAHAARRALGTPQAPTGLAYAMDCQIQHLLVDEFQDTSQSQFELLRALTTDWEPDDGRTLFAVGDPMQSIYGFREADVALFAQAREQGLGRITLEPLTLSANFRSTRAVVDWVNAAVGPAFPLAEDALRGSVRYVPSFARNLEDSYRGDGTGVDVHPFRGDEPAAEAVRVLGIIRRARHSEPSGSIGVLVRSRAHLAQTVALLRRERIRFQAVEIDALQTRSVVQDLCALTRALVDPADRIAWLALLRAPWCGLTLRDLHGLAGADRGSAIWDLVGRQLHGAGRLPEGLSEDGRNRLWRVHHILDGALAQRGKVPLARWVEATWLALGGPACVESPSDLEDAWTWLDLLQSAAPGVGVRDEARFLDAMARLFAKPDVDGEEPPLLHLMTIHKAKGLEFDTVILPGLGRVTRSDTPDLMAWLEYIDRTGAARLLLAPIRESGGDEDRLARYVARIAADRRAQETTRLMYVAATRARKHLHLLGHIPCEKRGERIRHPDARSLLARIWPAVEPEFTTSLSGTREGTLARSDSLSPSPGSSLRRLTSDWTLPDPPEEVRWEGRNRIPAISEIGSGHPTFDWASDFQRRVGIVVHALLERLSPMAISEGISGMLEEKIRAALATEGVAPARMDEAIGRVRRALVNTITDVRGRWILGEHDDDHREYPIARVEGDRVYRYTLDRTFVDDGVRWIIDYKTGTHEGTGIDIFLDNEQERYRRQLEDYARAVRVLDRRPIRLGLYFPLLSGWREWPFGEEDNPPC